MMFGSCHLSTAAGCAATSNDQKIIKVRYGAFFSGMAETAREEEEYFARRKMKKSRKAEQQGQKEEREQQQQQRKGLSKKLLGKLVRLISVKDFPLLAIVKTFPSRDAKKAADASAKRRPHNSSQSSTLSGSFEPMPTIEEETESELLLQLMAEAEAWERQEEMERDEALTMPSSYRAIQTMAQIVQATA